MLILAIRSDKPEAEIGLYEGSHQFAYHAWLADRQLAETIHAEIQKLLSDVHREWQDVEGLVVYKGPGSFTGLRIGLTVANTLADSLSALIVGAMGEDWQAQGIHRLLAGESDQQVLPEYGAPPHITAPKK
jgi:tRNA threonylcarbamoyladenosine biosynthesis protein TsaB